MKGFRDGRGKGGFRGVRGLDEGNLGVKGVRV